MLNGSPVSKLEIDISQVNELKDASALAVKYNIPALVVHPNLINQAIILRGKQQGKYKIITQIDWPNGNNHCLNKFRGVPVDGMDSDGYEIAINNATTNIDLINMSEFIINKIDKLYEIRYVVLTNDFSSMRSLFSGVYTPNFIRNCIDNKIKNNKYNDFFNSNAGTFKIKVSGNINDVKSIIETKADRYAVNLHQAKTIINEFNLLSEK